MTRIDRMFASLAKLLLTVIFGLLFLAMALDVLLSVVSRFLPELIVLAVIIVLVCGFITARRRSQPPISVPPEIASLANHKIRRSRSTGSQL
jgi:hypothetical protein